MPVFSAPTPSSARLWSGGYIMGLDNDFDLVTRVQQVMINQDLGLWEDDLITLSSLEVDLPSPSPSHQSPLVDISTLSPLTSRESSPSLGATALHAHTLPGLQPYAFDALAPAPLTSLESIPTPRATIPKVHDIPGLRGSSNIQLIPPSKSNRKRKHRVDLTSPKSSSVAKSTTLGADLLDLPVSSSVRQSLPSNTNRCKKPKIGTGPLASTSDGPTNLEAIQPPAFEAASGPENMTAKQRRNLRAKKQSRANRQKHRSVKHSKNYGNAPPPADLIEKHTAASQPLLTLFDINSANHVRTGYIGLNRSPYPQRVMQLDELIGETSKWKFELVKWNGIVPIPLVDRSGTGVGLLVGRPNDRAWQKVQLEAAAVLDQARDRCDVSKDCKDHRRGLFTTLRTGFSHGGGQTHPQNLSNNGTNQVIVDELNAHPAFKRISTFTSSVFQAHAPALHGYYVKQLSALQEQDPSLKKPFDNSVFSSTTYNLGPETECLPHLDFGNLAFGLCAVTALGSFDSTRGGHLILWEYGLVIEFPPGSTILIPSALINHSNVAISKGERRYSFTQYSAGGLFRWVDHGFQTVETYRKCLKPAELAALDQSHANRWSYGLSLLPHLPWVPSRPTPAANTSKK